MLTVHRAELRGSWTTWAGVALAFIVTNFALMISALVLNSGIAAVAAGTLPSEQSTGVVDTPIINLVLCTVVGAIVIGTATQLALSARRGSLARLALAGAAPRQIVSTVMTQLVAVSIASSLIAAVLALALLRPMIDNLTAGRLEEGEQPIVVEPVYAIVPLLLAAFFAIGVAVVGGFRQTSRASIIAPVEALRVAATDGQRIRMTIPRILGAVVVILMMVGAWFSLEFIVGFMPHKERASTVLQVAIAELVLTAVLLALLAPVLVGPITRAWVRLVPVRNPGWNIARRTVTARSSRLVRSVVPVMMTVGFSLGMVGLAGSMNSVLELNGLDFQLSAVSPAVLLSLLGLPLAIALAGGVGSLIMMSKQRDAELALLGIVGATPRQRLAIPFLEAVIISVTAAILGVVMAGAAIAVMLIGLPLAGWKVALVVPWEMTIGAVIVTLAITVVATVLPTLKGRMEVEPVLIGRLIAD